MAKVIVTATARLDLDQLIRTHSLPATTRERVKRSLEPLRHFPLLGAPLHDRWAGFRFILGLWRWMIIVYHYHPDSETVAVVTIQDGRNARAPTSGS